MSRLKTVNCPYCQAEMPAGLGRCPDCTQLLYPREPRAAKAVIHPRRLIKTAVALAAFGIVMLILSLVVRRFEAYTGGAASMLQIVGLIALVFGILISISYAIAQRIVGPD